MVDNVFHKGVREFVPDMNHSLKKVSYVTPLRLFSHWNVNPSDCSEVDPLGPGVVPIQYGCQVWECTTLRFPWNGVTNRRGFRDWGQIDTRFVVRLGSFFRKMFYGPVIKSFHSSSNFCSFRTLSFSVGSPCIPVHNWATLRHRTYSRVLSLSCNFFLIVLGLLNTSNQLLLHSYNQVINTISMYDFILQLSSPLTRVPYALKDMTTTLKRQLVRLW